MSTHVPDRMLRLRTVLDRTGLSRSTLFRKVHEGSFPKQIPIAARCTGWRESAVNDWMKDPSSYLAQASSPFSDQRKL